MNEKKDKKSCFYNNPEMAEYNCKHEKEVNIINTIDNKILEDVTQLTISENCSDEKMIISAPILKKN